MANIFGNFNNYYQFNRPESRLDVLGAHNLRDIVFGAEGQSKSADGQTTPDEIVCMDVGCNSGEMTVALQKHLSERSSNNDKDTVVHFMAVDLDDGLIRRAAAATTTTLRPDNGEITFTCSDIMYEEGRALCSDYLRTKRRQTFDICFCLSVTMWIHLNHEDDGLDEFLRFVSSKSDWLLIEPQPWKCYRQAARRMRRLGVDEVEFFERMRNLKVRSGIEDHIDNVLTASGMMKWKSFGQTPWKRSLNLYKKIN